MTGRARRTTASTRRHRWSAVAAAAVLLAALAAPITMPAEAAGSTAPAARAVAAAAPGPYMTLLFSRSEVAGADHKPPVRDDRNVAGLVGVVAPYLAARGLAATGTIQTGTTKPTTVSFTHGGMTSSISWSGATGLATTYGWTFVSHSATYPTSWTGMSESRMWAETCGSAAAIAAHGLPGSAGLYAWPSDGYVDAIQAAYVSTCIAFGRQYSKLPTTQAYALTPPYYQHTEGMNGGSCNDRTASCWSVPGIPSHYDLPATIISRIRALQPGQWFTLQAYLLVTGKSPPYTTSTTRWDCTAADPRLHWSNDNERYCWSDYQTIVNAIPSAVVVTDPLTVAHAFGRPGY
jgi:hypothetical protein